MYAFCVKIIKFLLFMKENAFSALGIGRCYKNLEYTWIIAEQTDVSDLSAINHVIRTRVRNNRALAAKNALSKGPLLRVAGRRAQIWYYAIMQNLMWYEGADGFVFSLTALSYFL